MKIISARGRAVRDRAKQQRQLEEKFQVVSSPLSEEDKENIHRVFDRIRRELGKIRCLTLL